jgi:hypothetical protein
MVIIGIMSYPPESANEMAKRLLAQPALPPYITMKGHYIGGEVREGIQSISIYEFDDSKFSEANEFVAARITRYFGVPGLTYSMHPWLEVKQALTAIGMGQKPKAK